MKCLVKGATFDIPVQDMKDGELAVVTTWGPYTEERRGLVVQRVEKMLLRIGKPVGKSWTGILDSYQTECRVRLLEVGETIELVK